MTLRKYERVWFEMHGHPQVGPPEVFLAYDFEDALVQSREANRRFGHEGHRWVTETRPHDPEAKPE